MTAESRRTEATHPELVPDIKVPLNGRGATPPGDHDFAARRLLDRACASKVASPPSAHGVWTVRQNWGVELASLAAWPGGVAVYGMLTEIDPW
jgi:hypothetical protein